MATRTRDTALPRKERRGTSPSTTKIKPLVQKQANQIASNKSNIPNYLMPKVSPAVGNTQGKRLPSLHDPNIHNKQTLNQRSLLDKPPLLSGLDNTQGKDPPLSNDINIIQNKPNPNRRKSIEFRPPPPSSTIDNALGKKLASSSSDSNIHNKQTLARRTSLDYKAALTSTLDGTQGKKLASSSSDSNLHNKQILARRSSFDHKLPLSSPLPKNRTSPNPKERILRPSLSLSSTTSTSQKPLMNKLSKIPHPSKDVMGKKHSPGLYARAVKQDSPASLAQQTFITSTMTEIVENIAPKAEELEQEEHKEPINYETYDEIDVAEARETNLVIEDHVELSEIVNIDEYLKAAESSLYVVENQEEVIKMEVPEEQLLVEETSMISYHKELEEINNEPSNLDLEEVEKQEIAIKALNEDQVEKEEAEDSEIKALDYCQQEKEESKEIEIKVLDVNIQQEKDEGEGGNYQGKEGNKALPKNKTTMAFAKPCPHLLHGNKKESVVSNDVIEETASKLREQRKNRVKALAGAFETVISLQDPRA